MNKDKHDKAMEILVYYHAEGNADDEFVQLEFAEIKAAIELDKQNAKNGWIDFLKTKGNRKRIGIITALGFFSQWSGNGLISYYLTYVMDAVGITKAQTQLGVNAGMNTENLVMNVALSFFADVLGRRPMYITSTIGTFLTFNAWTIISARYDIKPNNGLGYAFVVFTFLYSVSYNIKTGILSTYTTEILPYGLRAKGYTWLNFCVCVSLFFNQYINGIALDAIHWKYYIAYCIFLAFEVFIVYYFVIETRYTPMEEIAKFFDGEDAIDVGEVAAADLKEKGMGFTEEKDGTSVHELEGK